MKRLIVFFVILILTLPIIPRMEGQVKFPEYVKPGNYFYYNGTLQAMGSIKTVAEYRGLLSFEYNFTILAVDESAGSLEFKYDRKIYINGSLVKEEHLLVRSAVVSIGCAPFFILADITPEVIEAMCSSLAMACYHPTINVTKINYTSEILGTVEAYYIEVNGVEEREYENGTYYVGSYGHLIIAENGLLLETTLKYINTLEKTPNPLQMEEYGGLALKLAETNAFQEEVTIRTLRYPLPILLATAVIIAVIVAVIIIMRKRGIIRR